MPTPDCDCYKELINMKETFKRKCFGKSSPGPFKHLTRHWLEDFKLVSMGIFCLLTLMLVLRNFA